MSTKKKATKAAAGPTLREFLRGAATRCAGRVGDAMFRRLATEVTVDARVSKALLAAANKEGAVRAELLDEAVGHARKALGLLDLPASDPGHAKAPDEALTALFAAERAYGVALGDLCASHASTALYASGRKANLQKYKPNHEGTIAQRRAAAKAEILREWGNGKAIRGEPGRRALYKTKREFARAKEREYLRRGPDGELVALVLQSTIEGWL